MFLNWKLLCALRGHLAVSGDVLNHSCGLGGERSGMLLNTLHCRGQIPTTKTFTWPKPFIMSPVETPS